MKGNEYIICSWNEAKLFKLEDKDKEGERETRVICEDCKDIK